MRGSGITGHVFRARMGVDAARGAWSWVSGGARPKFTHFALGLHFTGKTKGRMTRIERMRH